MAHPIRPDVVIEMNNFYTVTVYEKGSEVIRMLHTLLGEERFQAGMRIYIERHDGEAATCEQFVQAMEAASGRQLQQFRRWYSQAGTPELQVRDEFDATTGIYRLHVRQWTRPTAQQQEKLPLHIPLRVALYEPSGAEIPLSRGGEVLSDLLELTQEEQTFTFEQVPQRPIIALLLDFSAPVKLDYPYSEADLGFLLSHARNDFCRWDAGQMLVNQYISQGVTAWQSGQPLAEPSALIAAFAKILNDSALDKALAAEILTIASESSLAELFDEVDIDAIHEVREHLLQRLAQVLYPHWLQVFECNKTSGEYQIEAQQMARRALANLALSYLARSGQPEASDLVQSHYQHANNMTDLLAAMQAASGADLPVLGAMLRDFEQKWQHDGLVMDNWFRLQASRSQGKTLLRVRELLGHPAFSLHNPNRVRALVGSFCAANPVLFHAKDGSGYQFLVEILTQLNSINPQVAARLIVPLIQFKRLDAARQQRIRLVLQQLAAIPDLAKDLYEKISRALEH